MSVTRLRRNLVHGVKVVFVPCAALGAQQQPRESVDAEKARCRVSVNCYNLIKQSSNRHVELKFVALL